MKAGKETGFKRPPIAAQMGFYPLDPAELKSVVRGYLSDAEKVVEYAPFGLIAPHAGFAYSGPVAGWAYRQIMDHEYRTVIILAPSHSSFIPFISVMPFGDYITPLGEVEVDDELANELITAGDDLIKASRQGHLVESGARGEHSLEVHLPFLQVALNDFKIVPVIVGAGDWESCRKLGKALAKIVSDDVLIVASSDLSHFHSYDEAYRLDENLIEMIRKSDARGIAVGCNKRELEACGGAPISALLEAAGQRGAGNIDILRHKTSGDVSLGSRDQVVGYLAASIGHAAKSARETVKQVQEDVQETGSGLMISEDVKNYLITLAKDSVQDALDDKPLPATAVNASQLQIDDRKIIDSIRAIFVTLKVKGQLRGCIGNLSPAEPLRLLVPQVARQAAFNDPRFPPLTKEEFEHTTFEITVLGEMIETKDPLQLEVGRHGILLRRGYRQGLLLPQVAVEWGWECEQFLDAVCQKAGLKGGAWKEKDSRIFLFTADCFGE